MIKNKCFVSSDRFVDSDIYHHGIKGQRWGVRRWQNPDGSLTPAGRIRYADLAAKSPEKAEKFKRKLDKAYAKAYESKRDIIARGDDRAFKKNKKYFTNQEIREYQERNRKESKSTVEKIASVVGKASSLMDSYGKAAGIVNRIAGKEVMKSFSQSDLDKKLKKARLQKIYNMDYETLMKNKNKISSEDFKDLENRQKSLMIIEKSKGLVDYDKTQKQVISDAKNDTTAKQLLANVSAYNIDYSPSSALSDSSSSKRYRSEARDFISYVDDFKVSDRADSPSGAWSRYSDEERSEARDLISYMSGTVVKKPK